MPIPRDPLSAFLAEAGDPLMALDSGAFARVGPPQPRQLLGVRVGSRRTISANEAAGLTADAPEKVIAVLPLSGPLMARSRIGWGGMVEGMDSWRARLGALAADPRVAAIVLDVNSPGGTVAGTPETAEAVAAASAEKTVVAVANSTAASAAYWIAAAAGKLVVTPSGEVGSVGVLAMHVDISRALENDGVRVSLVHAGPHKVELWPFAPLSDEARAALQQGVDSSYAAFVDSVAAGRKVTAKTVREAFGGGRMVDAKPAKAAGMVDSIATLDRVVADLAEKHAPRARRNRRFGAL